MIYIYHVCVYISICRMLCVCVCVCVCVCNGILFGQKKEGNSAICNNIDGPQGHYGK